jgi:lysophospholipase L1-like esterase
MLINLSDIDFSDYVRLERRGSGVKFDRIIEGASGFRWDSPGTRIRFRTDATEVRVKLFYSGEHSRLDAINGVGVYLIDGERAGNYEAPPNHGALTIDLPVSGDSDFHLYEVLLPYGDAVELDGIEVNEEARIIKSPPRPSTRWLAYGDSITHGFYASDVTRNYPFQVGEIKGWQVLNLGFGSHQATPDDGKVIAGLQPSVVSIAIGANDCVHNKDLNTYKQDMRGVLSNVLDSAETFLLYIITPLTVLHWGEDNVEERLKNLRGVLRDLVEEMGNSQLRLIEGPSLIPAQERYFQDGLHPNDDGFRIMAENLASLINE